MLPVCCRSCDRHQPTANRMFLICRRFVQSPHSLALGELIICLISLSAFGIQFYKGHLDQFLSACALEASLAIVGLLAVTGLCVGVVKAFPTLLIPYLMYNLVSIAVFAVHFCLTIVVVSGGCFADRTALVVASIVLLFLGLLLQRVLAFVGVARCFLFVASDNKRTFYANTSSSTDIHPVADLVHSASDCPSNSRPRPTF